MALEQVFECPTTLVKLRCGPLGTLLEGFCTWLLESGFGRSSIRGHLSNLSHLNDHLGGPKALMRQTVTAADLDGFFETYPSRCRNRGPLEEHLRRVRYSVNRFAEYLRQEGRFVALSAEVVYQPILDAYLQWMDRYQHAAQGTLELRAQSLIRFLQWLGPEATPQGLAKLNCQRVEQFFLGCTQGMGRSARRSMQSALRTFFRFCLHRGYVRQPLDRAVPTLRTYKLATVPRGLTDQQAQQTLRSVNRTTPVGRRDYAILQLLYAYGVRGGQVRALRLEDIDWTQNQILFKASKRGKDFTVASPGRCNASSIYGVFRGPITKVNLNCWGTLTAFWSSEGSPSRASPETSSTLISRASGTYARGSRRTAWAWSGSSASTSRERIRGATYPNA